MNRFFSAIHRGPILTPFITIRCGAHLGRYASWQQFFLYLESKFDDCHQTNQLVGGSFFYVSFFCFFLKIALDQRYHTDLQFSHMFEMYRSMFFLLPKKQQNTLKSVDVLVRLHDLVQAMVEGIFNGDM